MLIEMERLLHTSHYAISVWHLKRTTVAASDERRRCDKGDPCGVIGSPGLHLALKYIATCFRNNRFSAARLGT
jgi:hypothetical protein